MPSTECPIYITKVNFFDVPVDNRCSNTALRFIISPDDEIVKFFVWCGIRDHTLTMPIYGSYQETSDQVTRLIQKVAYGRQKRLRPQIGHTQSFMFSAGPGQDNTYQDACYFQQQFGWQPLVSQPLWETAIMIPWIDPRTLRLLADSSVRSGGKTSAV
ncbi:unnamed protein product [Fusarium equiseti]|uniref:Uncharacterized protein n=1 Tax=Fusarium equiseti TaxID=61235 RepID=A0A8J2IPN3_FUSEQ|nr:unnamed protein product [Fusarium equiseti]